MLEFSRRHRQVLCAKAEDTSGGAAAVGRILLVEDDFLVGLEIEHRLNEAGLAVVGIAATADEAVAIADVEKPDVAVMDIRLSGSRDGVDAAIELFERFHIRSIFATAHSNHHTVQRAKPAQPLAWLQKPYSADALIAAIRSALQFQI